MKSFKQYLKEAEFKQRGISEEDYGWQAADSKTVFKVKEFLGGVINRLQSIMDEEDDEDSKEYFRNDMEEVGTTLNDLNKKDEVTLTDLADAILSYDTDFRENMQEWAVDELGQDLFDRITGAAGWGKPNIEPEPDFEVEKESQMSEEDKKKKTQTKDKPADIDWSGFDDLFKPKADQPLAKKDDEPKGDAEPAAGNDQRKKAGQADTLRATGNIHPTDNMRSMLSRMRDIEGDEDDGYPDPEPPENLPSTQVNTANLPAVAGQALRTAGVQDPDFHKVANLPGNMSRAIRTLGKQLFRSLTRTDTDDVWMVGNLGGQGPNSRQEVNSVAGWVRDNGQRITQGEIDFDTTIPGYQADIQQWSANGIRWLLVRDEFGDYIYSWPESDSVTQGNNDRLAAPNRTEPRRIGR